MSIFGSLKAEIECEMYGRNARILTVIFLYYVNLFMFKPLKI